MRIAVLALLILLLPTLALADRVHMKSGFDFDVDAWREDGDEIVYQRFGGEIRIKKADVARIERRSETIDTMNQAPGSGHGVTGSGLGAPSSSGGDVNVKGYYRKSGTYVAPHTRSAPGSGGRRGK